MEPEYQAAQRACKSQVGLGKKMKEAQTVVTRLSCLIDSHLFIILNRHALP